MNKKTIKEKISKLKEEILEFTELNGLDYDEFIYTALNKYLMNEKYLPTKIEVKTEIPKPKVVKKEDIEFNQEKIKDKDDFYGE